MSIKHTPGKHKYRVIALTNDFTIDFHKLALLQPSLRPHVLILNYRTVINFKKQTNLILLARAIMKHIFGYQWDCPLNNLCPRIPSRINYLLWVYLHAGVQVEKVMDVGTGATVIYPLLGYRMFLWRFVASQICKVSYQHARGIIKDNQLEHVIDLRLCKVQHKCEEYYVDTILLGVIQQHQHIDVVICNPPFFEIQQNTISPMIETQHHIQDGQYGFFFQMYKESFHFNNIKVFTSLIGRKVDFYAIKQFLENEIQMGMLQRIEFGEIIQGNNTRYIVLWKVMQSQILFGLQLAIHKGIH